MLNDEFKRDHLKKRVNEKIRIDQRKSKDALINDEYYIYFLFTKNTINQKLLNESLQKWYLNQPASVREIFPIHEFEKLIDAIYFRSKDSIYGEIDLHETHSPSYFEEIMPKASNLSKYYRYCYFGTLPRSHFSSKQLNEILIKDENIHLEIKKREEKNEV